MIETVKQLSDTTDYLLIYPHQILIFMKKKETTEYSICTQIMKYYQSD